MKKNSSMQGTLNKLFGKKNNNINSLYADNPPWIKPQGAKKTSADYHDEVHNSFSFLDDSGTATLKARPGPRVRPVLQFSASHAEIQGLAVPTPSVPSGYTDNPSLGNGPKFNGNYRMYSSVGDLRLMNYEYSDEEIPAPPSVPPPPPPTVITVAPPQESNYSSTVSSPSSPSPPDFIPPTPNSSAPSVPNFLPYRETSVASTEQQSTDVPNWKSETELSAGEKEMSTNLLNRFSLNPAGFQDSHGPTITEADPQSTLPKSFKVPPPAPIRTSSIQLQEYHDINYSKDSTQSPVRSSFNPNAQAKLFSVQENKFLNDAANKRKSMLIMDDQQDVFQNIDLTVQKPSSVVDFPSGTLAQKSSEDMKTAELEALSRTQNGLLSNSRQESELDFDNEPDKLSNKINTPVNGITLGKRERSSHSLSTTELNKMPLSKDGLLANGHKSSKPQILSVKPILTNLPISTINVQTKQNSLTRKETATLPKEREKMQNDLKVEQKEIAEVIQDTPPSPPPMSPPPPPPLMMPPKPPTIPPPPPPPLPFAVTPPKTSLLTSPPGSPLVALTSPLPQVSPLLPSKPKLPTALAPPIHPSLSKTESSQGPQVPLLKALQEKQQTLRQIPKKSVEIRAAHVSSVSIDDNDQKVRVGKIKGELEALFSPKKDEKVGEFKNFRPGAESNKKHLDANKKNGNTTQSRDGENTLVNSLMLKVPLISVKQDKEELDGDWNTKNSQADIQIPEPDYQPTLPNQKSESLDFSSMHSEIIMPTAEMSSKPALPLKVTDVPSTLDNMPTYKPHSERNELTESWTLDKISLKVSEPVEHQKPDTDHSNEEATASVILNSTANENVNKHLDIGEQEEISSPMALLMAAKRRAQKGNRSVPLDRSNLPKISISRGIVKSSFSSQYNEEKINISAFPKKDNAGYFSQEEATNFIAKPSNHLDQDLSISRWTDGEFNSSSLKMAGPNSQKSDDEKATIIHTLDESFGKVSPEDRNEDFQNDKFVQYSDSTKIASFIDGPAFHISSVPSPIPASKRDELMDYGIIPPPAEFMNSPPTVDIVSHERGLYNTNLKSDLMASYGRNNQPMVSQTSSSSSSDFNKYRSGHYSTEIGRDQQKASLIKKRLYMPDPDSMRSYGKSTNTLRTSAYNHVHIPSSSSIVSEQRRSTNPSRYLSQGRRVSSENLSRMVSPITDLKYKPQNPEYSNGKSSGRPQSTYQQGMTFTVRPGTRQPITQMYQGGYL